MIMVCQFRICENLPAIPQVGRYDASIFSARKAKNLPAMLAQQAGVGDA
jgi:hypothetical protein